MRISREKVAELVTFGWRRGYDAGKQDAMRTILESKQAEIRATDDAEDIITTEENKEASKKK